MAILFDPSNPASGSPKNNMIMLNRPSQKAIINQAAAQQAADSGFNNIATVKLKDGKLTVATDGAVYNININGQEDDTLQYVTNYLTSRGASAAVIKSVADQFSGIKAEITTGNVIGKNSSITITDPNSSTKNYTSITAESEATDSGKQFTAITEESIAAGSGKRFIGEPVNDSDTSTDNSADTTGTDNNVSVTVDNSTAWTFTTPNGTVYTVPMAGLAWSDPAKMHEYITNYLASIGAPANVIMEAVSRMPDVMGNNGLREPRTDEFGNPIDNTEEIKNIIAGNDQSLAYITALKAFLDAKEFSSLSPEDQFKKAIEYGLIPVDSVYVPPDAGYNVGQNAPPGMPDDVAVSLGLLPSNEQIPFNVPNFNWAYLPKADADQYFAELKKIVGYDITSANLKQAMREAQKTITLQNLRNSSEAIVLKRFMRGEGDTQTFDIFAAYKAGIPDNVIERAVGLSKADSVDIKYLLKYVDDTGNVDIQQAVSDGWGKGILQKWFGLSDTDFKNAEFVSDYEDANLMEKIGMAFKKDPGEFMKNVGISMIPFYGTWKFKDENPGWLNAASLALDLAIFIPFVGGVSALAKTGIGVGKAIAKETLMTTRGLIVAPITTALHPIATTKALLSPLGVLLSKVRVPSAIFWRGSGSQTMDIAKVLANPAAIETTKAMDEAIMLRNGGKASGSVPILVDGTEIGTIKWSDAGFQTVLKNSVGHSTPFGEPFTKGVMAKDEGLFLSPNMNLGLTSRTATGATPGYVFNNKTLVGQIGENGRMVDSHNNIIGRIADNSKAISINNTKLGTVSIENNKAYLVRPDGTRYEVKIQPGGAIVAGDRLLGEFYFHQPVYKNGKKIGTIDGSGKIVDLKGNVIGKATPNVVGFLPPGTKVYGEGKVVVGQIKETPTFAIFYNSGLARLPNAISDARTMDEMASKAWSYVKSDQSTGEIFPVFKQYAKYIEDEALMTPGSRAIPVLDDKGKPVVLNTVGPDGKKINVPLLQMVTPDWFEKSLEITRALAGKADMLKPRPLSQVIGKVESLPGGMDEDFIAYMRQHPDNVLYGSTAEYTFTGGRKPGDLDIQSPSPEKTANDIANIARRYTANEVKVSKVATHYTVSQLKEGLWKNIADISELGWKKTDAGFKKLNAPINTVKVEGITMEAPSTQLYSLLNRTLANFEKQDRFTAMVSKLGGELDLGIGAKAPSLADLYKLKARGIYNTVRDIFIPNLQKKINYEALAKSNPELTVKIEKVFIADADTQKALLAEIREKSPKLADKLEDLLSERNMSNAARLEAARQIAPDLIPKVRELLRSEQRSMSAARIAAMTAGRDGRASALVIAGRLAKVAAMEKVRLEEEINRRAKLIEKELRTLPLRMPGFGNMSKTRITAKTLERKLRTGGGDYVSLRSRIPPSRGERVPPPRVPTTNPPDNSLPRAEPSRIKPPDFNYKGGKEHTDSQKDSDTRKPRLKSGDVAWKQGELGTGDDKRPVWIIKRANGTHEYVFRPPEGATRLEGTPEETFFTRGKKPPTNLTQKMGVTTAKINLKDNPEIKFVQTKAPKFKPYIPKSVRRSIGM
ncbi:serine/threonine protein phosphatase [Dehalococcoides mccartyi]|uniref:Serine/threonine protein phosphatase n=1 Tax=Dehalococcoides mccartyi TaxID=61435 RepID=A0AB33HSH9_9CHLR|nr:hypothetical protein [Dehalococcoides mccartyi]BAZ96694.1 serine/threonine protein phosphatase [Dehalococcoides mccartyi]